MEIFENDDSYGQLQPSAVPLAMGSSDSWLDYCREVEDAHLAWRPK